jgi:hypothetical protein
VAGSSSSKGESQHERIATAVVQNVCELPDYNSPDDQPELVMCTVTELHNCVMRALEGFAGETGALPFPIHPRVAMQSDENYVMSNLHSAAFLLDQCSQKKAEAPPVVHKINCNAVPRGPCDCGALKTGPTHGG